MKGPTRRDVVKSGLTVAAGLGLGLGAGGCGGPSRRFWHAGRPPNVVVVSLDTLRADRLHSYGNPRRTSDTLDALAREGLLFTSAFSSSPWTLPGHMGLFASTEPGKFFQSVIQFHDDPFPIFYKLQGDVPTIASTLSDRGYDTVGMHGAMLLDAVWGFDRGFREYTFTEVETHFLQAIDYVHQAARRADPFFLFVHSYVIHRPYLYESIFGSPEVRPPGLREMNFDEDTLAGHEVTPLNADAPLYGWQPGPEEVDYIKTVYDGGVWAADRLVRNLLNALRETGLYDPTMIVVLSDHGEEFWDHIPECSPDHNHSLFDELLRVPLIVKLPGGLHAGTRVDRLCRLHDVGPTIYEVAGAPVHGGATGRSLMPLVEGGDGEPRTLLAGQTYMGPSRIGLRTERYKYVLCFAPRSFKPYIDVPQEALYDLLEDPAETRNLVTARADVAGAMREELMRRRQADLPLSLDLDDELTRSFLPAMGLEEHAARLVREGRPSADVPDMKDASPELREMLDKLRSLGYAN